MNDDLPLPVADYETPILITLLESPSMGLSRQDALDRIKERVGRYMTDADFVPRPSPNDSQPIWVHHVDRMVQILVHDRDWVTHPYWGRWELTLEGVYEAQRRKYGFSHRTGVSP